jgi:hypothetical protein
MKGASLVVFLDETGVVMYAANVDPKTGEILNTPIEYGPEEIKQNKKFFKGNSQCMIRYPNSCCWKLVAGKWVCGPCP